MGRCKALAAILGLTYLLATGPAFAAEELGNTKLTVRFDDRGAVAAIVDRASGRDFARPAPAGVALYTITLAGRDRARTIVRAADAAEVKSARTPDGRAVEFTFRHADPPLTVRVRVRVTPDGPLSFWRLDVENQSPLAIVGVDFPGFALPQVLGADPDKTELIFPHSNNDQRYWNLPEEFKYVHLNTRKNPDQPIRWPLSLCQGYAPDVIQMMAFYDERAGLYLATCDNTLKVKDFAAIGLSENLLRLKIDHLRPWEFGKNFEMGYDVALGVFHGDWTAAADLYRDWAERQPWCAAGKLGKKDTPDWLLRYPAYLRIVLEHPNRNDRTRTPWDAFPARLAQLKQDLPDLLGDAMVHFVDFDIGGFWQGFYNERWPAWMGDDVFAERIRQLKAQGLHPKIEPFGWHNGFTDEFRPDYNQRKQPFWPDLLKNTLVWTETDAARAGGPIGQTPNICLGSAYGRSVFVDDARKTAPWGMDMVQIMEIGLVRRMQCFNPGHQHPLGPGAWIYQSAFNIFKNMREAGRAANPDFATDKEETAESLIPVLDTCYVRNAQMKNMRWNGRPQFYKNNVPLFDYVYHQYLTLLDGFQANSPETLRWCAGIAAVQGHLSGPLFGSDPTKGLYQQSKSGGAWRILQNAKAAYNSYARPHVVFGRTLPPPGVEFPEIEQPSQAVNLWQQVGRGKQTVRTGFVTPAVVQSAHQAADGSVGLSFINVSEKTVGFALDPAKYQRYFKSGRVRMLAVQNGKTVLEKNIEFAQPEPLKLAVEPLALLFVTLTAQRDPV